ncbi:hypothetical protein [Halococcoides cellulosivorans]|uniref:Uncharacterized protein n=1 Tax=Halococcoides cellulosivorans TaxID=1679096 RepID=A0A2R4WYN8_9EURY|nr:hypothetical protein [Halococcoides cellulosivorans]AWB26648.1 hypothetical protein HARCEL1_02430 [Halococcoides cellulosivorans]
MSEESATETDELDLESLLIENGILELNDDGTDLIFTDAFDEQMRAELDAVNDREVARERLLDLLKEQADPDAEVKFDQFPHAFRVLVDGIPAGVYPSEAALYADVSAAAIVEEYIDEWDSFEITEKGEILSGIRVFLEICPACGEEVTFKTEEVESCCGHYQTAAISCNNCGDRLYESPPLDE